MSEAVAGLIEAAEQVLASETRRSLFEIGIACEAAGNRGQAILCGQLREDAIGIMLELRNALSALRATQPDPGETPPPPPPGPSSGAGDPSPQ